MTTSPPADRAGGGSEPAPRGLRAPVVEETLRQVPVVVLTSARQTGKSTLVQHLPSAGARRYLTLTMCLGR